MIIVVGASASGKTELAKILYDKFGYKKCITTTTRKPRINEVEGIAYHFVTKSKFKDLLNEDEFVEVTEYHDQMYGLQKKDVIENGIVIVDPNGANHLTEKLDLNAYVVVVEADENTRRSRMLARGDEVYKVNERLKIDKNFYDYSQFIKINLKVKNENQTLEDLAKIIHETYQAYLASTVYK
jgi:guanylate kinase